MEFYGQLNLLKTGMVFADSINTVSPRYAQEIQRDPLGCGLEGVLHHRRQVLSGIINGVNYDVWNPATDRYLPAHYTADDVADRASRAARPCSSRNWICRRSLRPRWLASSAGWRSRREWT